MNQKKGYTASFSKSVGMYHKWYHRIFLPFVSSMQHTTSPMMFKKVRTQLFSTQRPNTAAAAPNQVSFNWRSKVKKIRHKTHHQSRDCSNCNALQSQPGVSSANTEKKHEKKQILRHYVWYGTCHNRHQLHLLKYKPCHTECPWQLPKTCVRHAGMGQIVKPRVPSISYIWPVQSGLRLQDVDHNKTS